MKEENKDHWLTDALGMFYSAHGFSEEEIVGSFMSKPDSIRERNRNGLREALLTEGETFKEKIEKYVNEPFSKDPDEEVARLREIWSEERLRWIWGIAGEGEPWPLD